MRKLEELLSIYGESDFYGFHMPGHKRNTSLMGDALPYKMDITELEAFDDLHHPKGILLEAQKRAAKLYHADQSFFLVNGSTVGNISAVMACTQEGGKILMARNCHKSVYNAVFLQKLEPFYLYPAFDSEIQLNGAVQVEDVEKELLKEPDIEAVVVVSPTYDGVISDIKGIAAAAHKYGIPLIVDEAHGAHFGFHEYFPCNANQMGADIVIHSVHKTLPAMTQTALLHMNGTLINRYKVKMYLGMLQSSSPSYILMASIDSCMDLIAARGKELFDDYVRRLQWTREKLKKMQHLQLVKTQQYDCSKIIISVRYADITSKELYHKLLKEYHLQMEMVAGSYVVGMTSIGDKEEGFIRLVSALLEIDSVIDHKDEGERLPVEFPRLERVCKSSEVETLGGNSLQPDEENVIASCYQYLYPPGIPIVVPGERVTTEVLEIIKAYQEAGFHIEG